MSWGEKSTFLAYWKSLRRIRKGDAVMTVGKDEQCSRHITTEADAERLWDGSSALRAEFESEKTLL